MKYFCIYYSILHFKVSVTASNNATSASATKLIYVRDLIQGLSIDGCCEGCVSMIFKHYKFSPIKKTVILVYHTLIETS